MTDQNSINTRVAAWLAAAIADAERRGLPELKPLLQGLAQSTNGLRKAHDEIDGRRTTGAQGTDDR